ERVVISGDDAGTREILPRITDTPILRFGESPECELLITRIDDRDLVRVTVSYEGQTTDAQLNVYGKHNAHNAVGVMGVLISLGYSLADAARAVTAFTGT